MTAETEMSLWIRTLLQHRLWPLGVARSEHDRGDFQPGKSNEPPTKDPAVWEDLPCYRYRVGGPRLVSGSITDGERQSGVQLQ